MKDDFLKRVKYPPCPKCKDKTLGVYVRGKLRGDTKLIFERISPLNATT